MRCRQRFWIFGKKKQVEHLLHLKFRQINFACCRGFMEGGKELLLSGFPKFSKMLHLDPLVIGKFLMKVDPEKLHTVARRGWRWNLQHEDLVSPWSYFSENETICPTLSLTLRHILKTRLWCALMLCNTHMKQLSKLAVKQTKLELKDFNGKAVKLNCNAS